jgi:hypothetical protein
MSGLLDNLINARFYSVNGVEQPRRQTVDFAGVGVSVAHDAPADKMTVTVADSAPTEYTLTTTDAALLDLPVPVTVATLALETMKVYAITVGGIARSSSAQCVFKVIIPISTESGVASSGGLTIEAHGKLTTWTVTVACVGLNAAVQLTGAVGATVNWAVRISTQSVDGFMPA